MRVLAFATLIGLAACGKQADAPPCNLKLNGASGDVSVKVGDAAAWTVEGITGDGRRFYHWFGTKNGVEDLSNVAAEPSRFSVPFPSNSAGIYTRYVRVSEADGNVVCDTRNGEGGVLTVRVND